MGNGKRKTKTVSPEDIYMVEQISFLYYKVASTDATAKSKRRVISSWPIRLLVEPKGQQG